MCLLGNRFDGPSSKRLHTTIAVGYDNVARGGGRIQVLAPLLDPVEGVVHGTKFSGIARGSPSTNPIRARGGRGHWAPYRPGGVFTREDDVDPQPADPEGRAESSVKRKAAGSSNRGSPGPVDFAMYFSAFVVECLFTSAGIPTV